MIQVYYLTSCEQPALVRNFSFKYKDLGYTFSYGNQLQFGQFNFSTLLFNNIKKVIGKTISRNKLKTNHLMSKGFENGLQLFLFFIF